MDLMALTSESKELLRSADLNPTSFLVVARAGSFSWLLHHDAIFRNARREKEFLDHFRTILSQLLVLAGIARFVMKA